MESTIPYSPVPKSHALSHKEKWSDETGKNSWANSTFATNVTNCLNHFVSLLGSIVEKPNFSAAREVLHTN